MKEITVYAPGAWCSDIYPAMEDAQEAVHKGELDPGSAEIVCQYWDSDRSVRRGRGTAHRFTITSESELTFLLGEAEYRADYNSQFFGGDYYSTEEKLHALNCRKAAEVLVKRCKEALARLQDADK